MDFAALKIISTFLLQNLNINYENQENVKFSIDLSSQNRFPRQVQLLAALRQLGALDRGREQTVEGVSVGPLLR